MQRSLPLWLPFTPVNTQATRVLPDQAVRLEEGASNDDTYHRDCSWLWTLLSVLANVIGGAAVLGSMFALPHIIGRIMS